MAFAVAAGVGAGVGVATTAGEVATTGEDRSGAGRVAVATGVAATTSDGGGVTPKIIESWVGSEVAPRTAPSVRGISVPAMRTPNKITNSTAATSRDRSARRSKSRSRRLATGARATTAGSGGGGADTTTIRFGRTTCRGAGSGTAADEATCVSSRPLLRPRRRASPPKTLRTSRRPPSPAPCPRPPPTSPRNRTRTAVAAATRNAETARKRIGMALRMTAGRARC